MATKSLDPVFAAFRRTSRVEDVRFWLRTAGPKMTPATKTDFEALLAEAQVDLDKGRMPTGKTLTRYIVLTQRYWSEKPAIERFQSHDPAFRRYDEAYAKLNEQLADAILGLKKDGDSVTTHGWTVTLRSAKPLGHWIAAATRGADACELEEKYSAPEAVQSAIRFLKHRLLDYFREMAMSQSAIATLAPEPDADQLDAWESDGGAVPVGVPSLQPPTSNPIAAPATRGRVLAYRYRWTVGGQVVEGQLEAANEKAARAAIREQHNLKWVPNGAQIERAS